MNRDELGVGPGRVCQSLLVALVLTASLNLATACSETVVHMKDGSTLKGRVQQAESGRITLTDKWGHTKTFDRRGVARVRHAGETEQLAGGIVVGIGGVTLLVGAAVYASVESDPDAGYDGYRVEEIMGGAGAMLAGGIIAVIGGAAILAGHHLESDSREAFDRARSVSLVPMLDPLGERRGLLARWRW